MLKKLLHAIVADPRVYNLVSFLFGSRIAIRHLRARTEAIARDFSGARLTVVDVGGGTGSLQEIWPAGTHYICLDPDPQKIAGFVRRRIPGNAIIASGDQLPLRAGSVDVVVMVAVSHHLTDATFDDVLRDVRRVLKPNGRLLYLDAIWNPRYLTGRLLWRYDRGAFPRPIATLTTFLERYFTYQHRERYGILHDYIVWVGRPASS